MTSVAGFGFRHGATLASLRDALAQALAAIAPEASTAPQATLAAMQPALPLQPIVLLAAPHDKADAACLRALAYELGLPVHAVDAAVLNVTPTLTDSAKVRALRGSGSTAEAAAWAAASVHGGPGAILLHPRAVSADRLATCAIAVAIPGATPAPQPTLES